MKIIQIVTLFIIAWEFVKIFIAPNVWNNILENHKIINNQKSKLKITKTIDLMSYVSLVYLGFMIVTKWWYVSLCILLFCVIMIFVMFPFITKNQPFDNKIRTIMLIESIITLLLLCLVIC